MAGTNDFLAFGTGGSANVVDQTTYAGLTTLVSNGFQAGVAESAKVNKVLRQASFVAAAVAKIIADNNVNALDDGNLSTFKTNLMAAIAAGVSSSGFKTLYGYNANQTLTASQVGSLIQAYGTTALTFTLPLSSACSNGNAFTIINETNQILTIQRQGSTDTMFIGNVSGLTSHQMQPGSTLVLGCQSGSGWLGAGGSAQLINDSIFASSLSTSGYQKLPSGLVIQWGQMTFASSTICDVTFPIAFPSGAAPYFIGHQRRTDASGAFSLGVSLNTPATASGCRFVHASATLSETDFWFAIGK